jgi:hypothetical protein
MVYSIVFVTWFIPVVCQGYVRVTEKGVIELDI